VTKPDQGSDAGDIVLPSVSLTQAALESYREATMVITFPPAMS
jgi:hypothetical protein